MNKKTIILLSLIVTTLSISGCAVNEGLYYAAPTLLPDTTRQMKTPGFWIARHPNPDQVILNAIEVQSFNEHIRQLKLTKDIFTIEQDFSADELKKTLQKSLSDYALAGYYFEDGKKAAGSFFKEIENNLNLNVISATIQYGIVVRYANQRILPTDTALNAKRFDIDFDELQNSALDSGIAVVILHESLDGKWFYVACDASDGWIKKEDVALGTKKQLEEFLSEPQKAVVIVPKADVYLDEVRRNHYDYVQMGVELPVHEIFDENLISVKFPQRTDKGTLIFYAAFMKQSDVHVGFLPFTPRNVIEQAFLMLNAPYGWGGMSGEQDCSRFLQMIFKTVGISLPRNSSAQAKVGAVALNFPKEMDPAIKTEMLANHAIAGATLLPMKGHIMLYLGILDGKPFAIHEPWAYRENHKGQDRIRVIDRVAVTSLDLGKGSQKGSLLERVNAIVNISP